MVFWQCLKKSVICLILKILKSKILSRGYYLGGASSTYVGSFVDILVVGISMG